MSLLIAYKRGDTVYMGTDTRVIVNECKFNELCESNHKIRRLENGMLVGITGDRLIRQTIFAYPEIFSLDKNGELNRRHIAKEIVPRLMGLMEEEGLLDKDEDVPSMKCSMFLAYKDVLYDICEGFEIYRYDDYQLLGENVGYGQFIIKNTRDCDDVNERIVMALDAVAKKSHLVGRPYLLINTKDPEYKLIRSGD